jgi:competence transcription factor ComK
VSAYCDSHYTINDPLKMETTLEHTNLYLLNSVEFWGQMDRTSFLKLKVLCEEAWEHKQNDKWVDYVHDRLRMKRIKYPEFVELEPRSE